MVTKNIILMNVALFVLPVCHKQNVKTNTQESPGVYQPTVKVLNVRTLPRQNSAIAFVISQDEYFHVVYSSFEYAEIDGIKGGWVNITHKDKTGFVFDGYIRKINPTLAEINRIYTDGVGLTATNGIIEGCFSYPSHGIPGSMEVCAENLSTKQVYCAKEKFANTERKKYRYSKIFRLSVPEGVYNVYELDPYDSSFRGDYTEGVLCGLTVDCKSKEKIPVNVQANQVTENILPHDYF